MKKNIPNFEDERYGSFFEPASDNVLGVDSVQYEAMANLLIEQEVDDCISELEQNELVTELRLQIRKIESGEDL
jgi:hypothetical protein